MRPFMCRRVVAFDGKPETMVAPFSAFYYRTTKKDKYMKRNQMIMAAMFFVGCGFTMNVAMAQQNGISRTDLVQEAISIKGHEAVQVRVDFEPGAVSIKHSHPGEEVAYVLEGSLEYTLEGRQPITLEAGEALFIPSGVAHLAKNVGGTKASELATYIVETGKTLVEPAK
ncbi:quercetin dioxygenase-like cupin family protein [Phyllobacterium brassicacearum]|nr:quercetin dioxygenase-like cupin family protein [Phyllobacterium brassicacearum]